MSISKGWQWGVLKENQKEMWRNPSQESYYLRRDTERFGDSRVINYGFGGNRHDKK